MACYHSRYQVVPEMLPSLSSVSAYADYCGTGGRQLHGKPHRAKGPASALAAPKSCLYLRDQMHSCKYFTAPSVLHLDCCMMLQQWWRTSGRSHMQNPLMSVMR